MTTALRAGSAHQLAAERFGRELDRAMAARRMGRRTLGAAVGVGQSAIQYHRHGRVLPRHDTVLRYAEVLVWPRLIELSRAARTKACETCGRKFMDQTSGNRRFCQQSCADVSAKRRAGTPQRRTTVRFEREARRLQSLIDRFCRDCDEDYCHMADCPLRPASPFPLAREPSLAVVDLLREA